MTEIFPIGKPEVCTLPLTVIERVPQVFEQEPLAARDFSIDSIDIYTNTGCNRRCNHCFLSNEQLQDSNFMTLESIDEIVAWAKDEGSSIEEITLLGGEFALHPQAREIIQRIDANNLLIRIVTNGSKPFRELLEDRDVVFALQKNRVAVSLESPDSTVNDSIRGRGAFQDAFVAIDQLRQKDIPFDINCTVVRSNQGQVPELLEFAESAGANRVNLHWFSRVGRAASSRSDAILGEPLDKEEWLNTLNVAESWGNARSGSAMTVDCELGFQYGLPGENLAMCAVRDKTNLQFAPDGTVTACGLLMDSPLRAGYIFRDGQLFERSDNDNELTQANTTEVCKGCPIRPTVLGNAALCIYNRRA